MAVQKFCFTALVLPHVFATLGDGTAHPLQIERSAMSPTEVVELKYHGTVLRGEASSGVELCPEEGPFPVCREGKPSVPIVIELRSREMRISSWRISSRDKKTKPGRAAEAAKKMEYRDLKLERRE